MGASVVTLGAFAAPALAQTAAPAGQPTGGAGADLVITAEKRVSTVQKVPVAVTAFTARQRNIMGITTVQDMTNFTPGLTYSSQLDRSAMRGLARLSNDLGADSSVAIYVDDFYSTSTYNVGLDDLFIDRVEIQRGPQGTLYGRNAIGGLINTISKRPTDNFTGEVRAEYGNFEHSNVEGTVSGPIVPGLDFRLSGLYTNQNQGYFHNVAGGPTEGGVVHDWYVNGTLEWKPTDKDDFWLALDEQGFDTDRGGPGSLLGVPELGHYDTAGISSFSAPLTYNPNYGYAIPPAGCSVNGAGIGTLACFSTGAGAPGTPNSQAAGTAIAPIPGTVVGTAGLTDNPALANIRNFAHSISTSIGLHNTFAVNFHYIHHFDGFDMKFVTGYSQYNYQLDSSVFYGDNSSITSFAVPLDPRGLCAALTRVGACSPLVVNPSQDFRYIEHNRWYSDEVTFSSTTQGPIQWIAGAFWYDQHYHDPVTVGLFQQPQIYAAPAFGLGAFGNVVAGGPANPSGNYYNTSYQGETQSAAGYGQIDWKINDQFKVTGGLRYTWDKKNVVEDYRVIAFSDVIANAAGLGTTADASAENLGSLLPTIDFTQFAIGAPLTTLYPGVTHLPTLLPNGMWQRPLSSTSDAVTGTAGVEWTPNHETLAYLRYNRGYKAFGFNVGTITPIPRAAPEFVDDVEIGLKQSFGNSFQYNIAGFWYDYQNDQVPVGVPTPSGISTEFFNIPKATSAGVELQVFWEPIPRLDFNLTYSYNFTQINSNCHVSGGVATGACFVDALDPLAVQPGAHPVGPVVHNPLTGAPSQPQSVSGGELPQAPANKFAANVNYTWQFDPGNLTLSATYVWKDVSYAGIFTRVYYSAPSWDEVDLRAVWSGDHDKYEVIGFVKNVFDTLGYDAAGGATGTVVPAAIVTAYDLTPPRTFGVEVHYKFQ
jgi:iron complex outermembrane recepter protein